MHISQPAVVGAERVLLVVAVRGIFLREDPLRGSLEEFELCNAIHDRGRDLHRGGTGADHSYPLAIDVDRMVPARTVEARAFKAVEGFDVGIARMVQYARR